MRIFITGISGLFGLNAALALGDKGHEVWGSYLTHPVELPGGRAQRLDLTEAMEVLKVFYEVRPDVVIHAAAATSVDACEEDPDKAKEINVGATRAVVRATASIGARLVHLSTDQVFGGTIPFAKESMPRVPVNEYGRTKLESESVLESEDVAVHAPLGVIVRTNFFGWGPPYRPSLSDWILTRLRAGAEVPGFEDVFFTPILVNDLIDRIAVLCAPNGVCGELFHVVGEKRVSKYEFARCLAEQFGENPEQVRATRLADAQLRAPRPLDMSLDGSKINELLGFTPAKLEFGLARLKGLEVQGWPERIQRMVARPCPAAPLQTGISS
nr:SDR family oxidoreductase [Nitrospirota bacterium]